MCINKYEKLNRLTDVYCTFNAQQGQLSFVGKRINRQIANIYLINGMVRRRDRYSDVSSMRKCNWDGIRARN